ncbi:MAG: hypothetical protein ACLFMO_04975 [Eubacteriales bacterium]
MKKKWLYCISLILIIMIISISYWYFYVREENEISYEGTFVQEDINNQKG